MSSAIRILYLLSDLAYDIVRYLSGLFGGCILFGGALLLVGAASPSDDVGRRWAALACLVGLLLLVAAGFLYVCLLGDRMRASVRHRIAAGVFLAVPILGGAKLLLAPAHPEMRDMGMTAMMAAALVFVLTVWPGLPGRAGASAAAAAAPD